MAMAAILALVFAGCGSSDAHEEVLNNITNTTGTTTRYVAYAVKIGGDLLTYGKTTVKYTDADGTEKTEEVTNGFWSKTVTITQVPFIASFVLKYDVDESELTKDTYDITVNASVTQLGSYEVYSTLGTGKETTGIQKSRFVDKVESTYFAFSKSITVN